MTALPFPHGHPLRPWLLAAALAGAVASPLPGAAATLEPYLKLPPIVGEANTMRYKNWIALSGWAWGLHYEAADPAAGTPAQPVLDLFSWTQGLDASWGPLLQAVATHQSFATATMDVYVPSQDAWLLRVTLSDAHVLRLANVAANGGHSVSAAMDYSAINFHYCRRNATGGCTFVDGGWTLSDGGRLASFSGDPSVMAALSLAGGQVQIGTVPEPATVALWLGGMAALGAGAWRRQAKTSR